MTEEPVPPPFYLVWNPESRAPTRKQPSLSVATAEAERLAKSNPGTFYILAAVGSARLTTLESATFPFDREKEQARLPQPAMFRDVDDDVPF